MRGGAFISQLTPATSDQLVSSRTLEDLPEVLATIAIAETPGSIIGLVCVVQLCISKCIHFIQKVENNAKIRKKSCFSEITRKADYFFGNNEQA